MMKHGIKINPFIPKNNSNLADEFVLFGYIAKTGDDISKCLHFYGIKQKSSNGN